MELSQAQLEEMVVGKPIDPTVQFYEQAILDVDASKKAGRRIYMDRVMIKRQVPGVTDYVAQRATAQDIKRWPREYQAFQEGIQRRKSPGLEILHGINNSEKQELIDRGFSTIELLANAELLPDHLQHLQPKARRIHMAIMAEESTNDREEDRKEEDRKEESNPEATLPREGTDCEEQRALPTVRGLDHRTDVGQPGTETVRPGLIERGAEGNGEVRREHRPAKVAPIDDWKVDLTWRQ